MMRAARRSRLAPSILRRWNIESDRWHRVCDVTRLIDTRSRKVRRRASPKSFHRGTNPNIWVISFPPFLHLLSKLRGVKSDGIFIQAMLKILPHSRSQQWTIHSSSQAILIPYERIFQSIRLNIFLWHWSAPDKILESKFQGKIFSVGVPRRVTGRIGSKFLDWLPLVFLVQTSCCFVVVLGNWHDKTARLKPN